MLAPDDAPVLRERGIRQSVDASLAARRHSHQAVFGDVTGGLRRGDAGQQKQSESEPPKFIRPPFATRPVYDGVAAAFAQVSVHRESRAAGRDLADSDTELPWLVTTPLVG